MPKWLSYAWYETCRIHIMAGLTFGFSLRFEGGRNIPSEGPALLVANHQSFIDPIAIGLTTSRQLHYLARKTLFKPGFGWFLRSVNCVPVDQEGVAKEGLKTILHLLGEGRAVLVFPEGERTWKGNVQEFKPGVHLLIRKAHVPIIPIGIAGFYEAYPRTRLIPRLSPIFMPATGAALAVSVGKPIPSDRYAGLSREETLASLREEIVKLTARAEAIRRKR